jgi:hypothetical protein
VLLQGGTSEIAVSAIQQILSFGAGPLSADCVEEVGF